MSHLVLSRHGIWYYRRIYLTARKRREIRVSLRTRSKREALERVQRYLASRPFPLSEGIPAHTSPAAAAPQPLKQKININKELKAYIASKRGSVGERELLTIERCVNAYLMATTQPFSKRSAADYVDNLKGSASTRNRYIKKNAGFFRWLNLRSDDEIKNPFTGMNVRDSTAPMDRRPAYTAYDLKQLHNSIQGVVEWRKWIILICRYSGMRQNEACQLYKNDVMQVNGTWCFRIDDLNEGQSLKTSSSRRFVPISSKLLEAGLLTYVDKQEVRLFPKLPPHLGSYAHHFSKWFGGFRKVHGLPEFHSLRHYAASRLKEQGVAEQFASQLLGHSNGTITYNRYGKSVDVGQLVALVEML
ncbi:site-specific integrase [Serratia rhizosphaerae]|uniref:site-specific integrase n=1 Tax=Serratia rhizosphaerae TaxID=2597702 RepID=UPI002DC0240E|nr:site-specific integrase [Serratia rhizosphaerae]MEB6337102.1 site-specific integrase [Serratia rhizosphaerae]